MSTNKSNRCQQLLQALLGRVRQAARATVLAGTLVLASTTVASAQDAGQVPSPTDGLQKRVGDLGLDTEKEWVATCFFKEPAFNQTFKDFKNGEY